MNPYLSTSSLESLFLKYKNKGVIIDTNLLLLLLIGIFDKHNINKYKRVAKYSKEDFDNIFRLSSLFKRIVVTPQILGELTNFVNVSEREEQNMISSITKLLKSSHEKYFEKKLLTEEPLIARIGFTDATILIAARGQKLLVITDDFPLTRVLRSEKCDLLNLNDIRTDTWLNT